MLHYASNLDPQIHLAFTSQAEGNLALHVNDDPQQVRANRARLEERIGVRSFSLTFMNQVHSATVLNAEQRAEQQGAESAAATCDGLISPTGTTPLAVMVADCLPVLLVGHNPQNNSSATAAVHAGRRGLLDGILPETVKQLTEMGATRIEAVIGPAICGRCYEVPQEMLEKSEARVPGIGSITSWDTPALDLPRAAAGQLRDLAVQVRNSGICTLENPEYYSYRRDRHSGRFAGIIWREN